jgi:hypothetical protein
MRLVSIRTTVFNTRVLVRLGIVLALAVASACSASPRQRPVKMGPVDTGAGSLTAARKYLEGRWTLLSFEVFPPGQPPLQLKGSGTLSYDAFGNLNMEIRVDEATSELLARAGIPTREGVLSTSGRTVVDMQARTLTYMIEGQPPVGAPSGPLATNRPRYWQVEGNVLTLTTKGDDGKPVSTGRWEKMQQE